MKRFALIPLFLVFAAGCARPFPEDAVFDLTLLTKLQHCSILNSDKCIFVTASSFNGGFDLSTSGNAIPGNDNGNGIEEADALCMVDDNYPGVGLYKAMMIDFPQNRVACKNANCLTADPSDGKNWVFQPGTIYKRASDGVVVLIPNSNGILLLNSSDILTNPFTTSSQTYWTGLNNDWTTTGNNQCTDWTDTGLQGYIGTGNTVNQTAIYDGIAGSACTGTHALVCVQK